MEEYIDLKILGRGAKGELTKKVRSKFDQKLYVLKELGQNKLTKNQKAVINIRFLNSAQKILTKEKLAIFAIKTFLIKNNF